MQQNTILKSIRTLAAGLFLIAATLPGVHAADDLQPIFNGTNLAGWKSSEPNPFWRIVDGVLVGENNDKLAGNVLFTAESYTNFVIELDVRWSGVIDSGIMLRAPELQLQFGVSRSLKKDMSCSFYVGGGVKYPEAGQAKGVEKLLKTDDWNKVRLEAKGDTYTVWLNGEQVGCYTDAHFPGGAPLGLQVHPGLKMKVEYRNIRAKRLD